MTAISAAAGIICLVAAALIWTVGERHTPRLTVLLIVTGTVGILGTPVGSWLRTAVGWVDQLLGRLTGALTGTVVTGLLAMASLYVLVVHLWKRTIDKRTLIAAVITPLAMATMPGVIGDVANNGISALSAGIGTGIGALLGMGG